MDMDNITGMASMVISGKQARLSRAELLQVRQCAARNGYAVQRVRTLDEALEAHLKALPPVLVEDLVRFFETGTSELTSLPCAEALRQRWSEV